MQRRLLKSAYGSCTAAIEVLETLKTADIKARKLAKPSAKSKWTRRIDATTSSLVALRGVRRFIREMPKRV